MFDIFIDTFIFYFCSSNCRHINHRTFKCDECDFWTVSQSYVNAHKKLKHVEIVYQNCSYPECKYTCRLIAQLKNHISIFHLGLLPYVCVDCGKSKS